jgi:hypothetical protein
MNLPIFDRGFYEKEEKTKIPVDPTLKEEEEDRHYL